MVIARAHGLATAALISLAPSILEPCGWSGTPHFARSLARALRSRAPDERARTRYHSGIEIGGTEYAYGGGIGPGSGVWSQQPRVLPPTFQGATFQESVFLGVCAAFTQQGLQDMLKDMSREWRMCKYSLLTRNWCVASFRVVFVSPRTTGRDAAGARRGRCRCSNPVLRENTVRERTRHTAARWWHSDDAF